ncbi:tRNA (cmo5U34)-methyltransferase [uncultured archaeon]|nr:tRNA (cmo5U34)-methyltransferase [uncultured archaeon]
MEKSDKYYFDELYKKSKKPFFGTGPSSLILKLNRMLPKNSKVLDLGCGEGKDAIFLARKGHQVTAVDISPIAIEKLDERAKKLKLNIKSIVADLSEYKIKDNYDAIIALASIHFLKKKEHDKMIKIMQGRTNKNGFNVIVSLRKGDPTEGSFKVIYLEDGKLKEYYSGWKIIKYKEYDKKDKHGRFGVHYHKNADLIAQRIV